jgi:hypothetical protein
VQAARPLTVDDVGAEPGGLVVGEFGATDAAGESEFRAFKFDVLCIEGGRIAEITTFDATLFPEFGLPPTL